MSPCQGSSLSKNSDTHQGNWQHSNLGVSWSHSLELGELLEKLMQPLPPCLVAALRYQLYEPTLRLGTFESVDTLIRGLRG